MKITLVSGLLSAYAIICQGAAIPTKSTSEESSRLAKSTGSLFYTTAINFTGAKHHQSSPKPGHCYNLSSKFNDKVSSIRATRGLQCYAYSADNCDGARLAFSYPGYADLRTVQFNDVVSSLRCHKK